MSHIYDNWERLVAATLDREKLRELALAPSRETSFSSSISSRSYSFSNFMPTFEPGGSELFGIFEQPIMMTYNLIKVADEAVIFKRQCAELKSKTKKLAALLFRVARVMTSASDLPRPAHLITKKTVLVLEKALVLVHKCGGKSLIKSVFFVIPTAAFSGISSQLEDSIKDMSWLLHITSSSADKEVMDEYFRFPPILGLNPILAFVWEPIIILYTGLPDDCVEAVDSIISLARDKSRYRKLIINEGGVEPLLKLLKGGKLEGQENAARAIGLLGKDPESVEEMIMAGVLPTFTEILKEGPQKVQAAVAWAVSEFAANYPDCQDIIAEQNIIWLLINHLIRNEVEENNRGREQEDPKTEANAVAMAARALWHLSKGNSPICQTITKSKALLHFALLMEKGPEEVRYNSAMALMEITTVAEGDFMLRQSAFKSTSPACKAVVNQLFRVVEKADSEILVPCIKAIGNLARTFRVTEKRMISPLVRLLDEREVEVTKEACVALTKFACRDNYRHLDHSKAIIDAEGAKHLVLLVYLGEQIVQRCALILLCYIAMNVPHSEELARSGTWAVLEWAMKQTFLVQEEDVQEVLLAARCQF